LEDFNAMEVMPENEVLGDGMSIQEEEVDDSFYPEEEDSDSYDDDNV
jgi:hypothetical protein